MVPVESRDKVVEMVLQAKFFFCDVKFLDIEYHFLLKSVFVVVNISEFLKRFLNAAFDFCHTFVLVLRHFVEQFLNAAYFVFKECGKAVAFLCAELHKPFYCIVHNREQCVFFGIVDFRHICFQNVWQFD